MNHSKAVFKAAAVGQKYKLTCQKFDQLLKSGKSEEILAIREKFHNDFEEYKNNGGITVAFVGQYSAGKSTIISALTGRRDIRIDADIATDKTSSYNWNGIRLIDTPGLFTERTDHDEITYEAIAKADLLVFCLTYMLFDEVTATNFKQLAFDKEFRWKMMLVVNKFSDESGSVEQKLGSYSHSLNTSLKPFSLDEFPLCFIDAKDYCDGIDEDEPDLIEESRLGTFIEALNRFVEKRSALARFDTPIRIALSSVDDAQIAFTRNSGQDSAYLEVLKRLSKRVEKERERLRTKVKMIILEMSSSVSHEGQNLADAVGDPNLESLVRQTEIKVRQHYENAESSLQKVIEAAVESIQSEIESELLSDLTRAFVARLQFKEEFSTKDFKEAQWFNQLKGQVGWLQEIGKTVGLNITTSATRGILPTASQGFLRSMDVAGSQLHQTVYGVGKFLGFKFQPWQAVGIAKNIGNAAQFLGPILGIVSVGFEIGGMMQAQQREQKMADARRDITSQFKAAAISLEEQIESQLREFEEQVYNEINQKINKARQQAEDIIESSSEELSQLSLIRADFEKILRHIQKSVSTEGVANSA